MLNISPADRNKAIGLVIGVVLVFGYLFFKLFGQGSPAQPPAAVTISQPGPKTAMNTPTDSGEARVVDIVIPATAGAVDPFRSVVSDSQGGGETASAPPSG